MSNIDFNTALINFANVVLAAKQEYKESSKLTYFDRFNVTGKKGPKYVKVFISEIGKDGKEGHLRIHSFVEIATGNVYKPATFNAPAKHSRGNIYVNEGRSALGQMGEVRYL